MSESDFSRDRIEQSFSSRYHCWLFYSADQIGGTLFDVLSTHLPHLDSAEIPARTAWGGVFINGLEVNENRDLPVPCKLEYYEPRFSIETAHDFFPAWSDEFVLFEDQFLIALFKPAKLPSIPGKEQKYYNMKSYVEKYTGCSIHMPSRLDMSTSGMILMSKNPETHKSIQRLYEKGAVRKSYLLGTAHRPEWTVREELGSIGKDLRHPVLRSVVSQGGKAARTLFTRLSQITSDSSTICLAQPYTGRTHQIRVHAAHCGIPLIGDVFYGGASVSNLRLMAYGLSFRHPKGGAPLELRVPKKFFPDWLPFETTGEVEEIIQNVYR